MPAITPIVASTRAYSLAAGFGKPLAATLEGLGQNSFYERMVEFVRYIIPCDFWIVARYEGHAKPMILSENGMNAVAKTAYSDTLWQLDPLCLSVRPNEMRAVSIGAMREKGDMNAEYAHYLDRTVGIKDELALLFPVGEKLFLAICLDRRNEEFTLDEIRLAIELQDVLVEMHRQHVARTLDAHIATVLEQLPPGRQEVLVMSSNRTVIYQSEKWMAASLQAFEDPDGGTSGQIAVSKGAARNGWALNRMACDRADTILGNAHVYVLSRNGLSFEDHLDRFSRLHALTERQKQIVKLSIEGHPNASIARRLDLSVGGVKNHKLRIYDKLDITSERELVSAFISRL